jgi:hypothetical protein
MKGSIGLSGLGPIFVTMNWLAAEEDNTVANYHINVTDGVAQNIDLSTTETELQINDLMPGTDYTATVQAEDNTAQLSNVLSVNFTTTVNPYSVGCTDICVTEDSASSMLVTLQHASAEIQYSVNGSYYGGHMMDSDGAVSTFDEISGLAVGDRITLAFVVFAPSGAYNVSQKDYYFTGL